ncbi:MAG: flagellar hook-length control protein FliK [Candidatus Gastranaerophilales bacterium]|nr:flagellar hook-length control protein FliK [Candidatus Gastranaerophilales bacterium]
MTTNDILNLNNILKPQISNESGANSVFNKTFGSSKNKYTTNIESNFSNIFENAKKNNVASKNKDYKNIKNAKKINTQKSFNENIVENMQHEKIYSQENKSKINQKNADEKGDKSVDDLSSENVSDLTNENTFQTNDICIKQNETLNEANFVDNQNAQTTCSSTENQESLANETSTILFLNAQKTTEVLEQNDIANGVKENQTIQGANLSNIEKKSESSQENLLVDNQTNENYPNEIEQKNNQNEPEFINSDYILENVENVENVEIENVEIENVENEVNKNFVNCFEDETMSDILSENDIDLKELNIEVTQVETDLDSSNEKNSSSENNQSFTKLFTETSAKYNFENTNNLSFNNTIKVDSVSQMNLASKLNQNVNTEMVNKENILNQIANKLENLNDSQSKVNIVLRPENLGRLQLEIVSDKNGTISANLTATNEDVKQLLEKSINELKNALNSQGVNVNNIKEKVENTNQASNNGLNYQHQNNENLNNSFNGEARNSFGNNDENQNLNYANNLKEMKSSKHKTNENLNSDLQNSSDRLVDLKV